jgi:hypothetical protein
VASASQKAQRSAPELSVGATVTVKSPRLGTTAGQVSLRIDSRLVPCEVTAWMDNKVTFVVPEFDVPDDRPAILEVSRADGKVFRKFPVQLLADDAEVVVAR